MVSAYAELLVNSEHLPLGGYVPPQRLTPTNTAPKALIFSPHPDDECIIGGLPLRLLRELGMNVINVAVTLGSRKARQAERWQELQDACGCVGFGVLATAEQGLEQINLDTRDQRPEHWATAVSVMTDILLQHQPRIIFIPHDNDWNSTHIGTHYLLFDALSQMAEAFSCWVVETEFWGAMDTPNILVESSVDDVADLIAALSCHRGEVLRNPYHLRLPAWLMDNVRRGSELVQGQGEAASDMHFATLYRLRRWSDRNWQAVLDQGQVLSCNDDLRILFAQAQN